MHNINTIDSYKIIRYNVIIRLIFFWDSVVQCLHFFSPKTSSVLNKN